MPDHTLGGTLKFKSLIASAGASALLLLTLASPPAQAAPEQAKAGNTRSAADKETLERLAAWYTEHGVPDKQKKDLLRHISNGGVVESDRPGTTPSTSEKVTEANAEVTVNRFSDGSITVSKVEKPVIIQSSKDEISLLSVGQCQGYSGGSGYAVYYDCLAEHSNSTVHLAFRATYTLTSGYDQINNVWGAYQYAWGGTNSTPNLRIEQKNEAWNSGARAASTVRFTPANSGNSTGYTMRLWVMNNSAFTNIYNEG
ncbi:hypothetical protein HC749_14290 [Arthrobacter sp. S13_S34]|nr:hypothetical protein [Arthrobacter sp. S13_S34]